MAVRHFFIGALLLALLPGLARSQNFLESGKEFQRTNPKFLTSFRPVVARSSQSTVRVFCDDRETALGMVVDADGWILTKANDLHGKIACQLRDGRTLPAQLVGVHYEHDLAMLKIEARGLVPVEWKDSKSVQTGTWVALPGLGQDPVAIGVVSVPTRKVPANPLETGYLGVMISGDSGPVRVTKVSPKSAASRAGLKVDDIILSVEGEAVSGADGFIDEMRRRKPGQIVALKIRRGDTEQELYAILGQRPRDERSELQNRLGGELSHRIGGYSSILQHDSVVKPNMCGGPIVDLDGKVIGINICRAGRTESWAVPSEVVRGLLQDLMSGKLPPRMTSSQATVVPRMSGRRGNENLVSDRHLPQGSSADRPRARTARTDERRRQADAEEHNARPRNDRQE